MYLLLVFAVALIPSTAQITSAETLTVKEGETLTTIAKENNLSLRALMEMNNIYNPQKLKSGQILILPEDNNSKIDYKYDIYIVKAGDSIEGISKEHQVSKKDLVNINNIENPDRLVLGQKIYLPKSDIKKSEIVSINQAEKHYHIIAQGDTLTSISNYYQIPVKRIIEINQIKNPNSISLGTKIALKQEQMIYKNKSQNIAMEKPIIKDAESANNRNGSQVYQWREYGPLKINWTNWKSYKGNNVAPSIHKSGKPLFIAVNCQKRKINRTGSNGAWRNWISPLKGFEHQLINDFCQTKRNL